MTDRPYLGLYMVFFKMRDQRPIFEKKHYSVFQNCRAAQKAPYTGNINGLRTMPWVLS